MRGAAAALFPGPSPDPHTDPQRSSRPWLLWVMCPQPPQGGAREPVLVSEKPEEVGREEGVRAFWVPYGPILS